MKSQISDLSQLLKKYKIEKENLEKQIKEKTEKVKIVYEALKLLEQEGSLQNTQSLSATNTERVSLSEKYKGMGLNDSILSLLADSEKYLYGDEIYEELIKHGFSSGSGDIKRDVYISLYRLKKGDKLISRTVEKRKKYLFKADVLKTQGLSKQ